uniref:Uncharacterized protein n=1 Tax=Arion vulgaris TaxID=1028688 RepID=A0A0B6ZHG9_9EUPU
MNKNDQLLKLIKRTDDAKKGQSGAKKEHFQIDKVPVAANALMLRTLFPFSAEVIFSTAKKTPESGYRGPVSVHYASVAWIDAVLDCCSNFTYNEYNLSIQHTRKKQETKTKPATEVKKDAGTVPKRGAAQDGTKTVKDGNSSSGSLSDNNT